VVRNFKGSVFRAKPKYPFSDILMTFRTNCYLVAMLFALIISNCTKSAPAPASPIDATSPLQQPEALVQDSLATATYIPNTTFIKVSVWMPPFLAETVGVGLQDSLKALSVGDATSANVNFEVSEQNVISQWVYALVAPFPTTIQGVSKDDLHLSWQGQPSGPYAGQPILLDQNTYDMFSATWGPPAPNSIRVMAKNELIDYAWAHQPAWAIVPFESLDPRWKVLSIDGLSALHNDLHLDSYALKIPVSLTGDPDAVALVKANFPIPSTNRDPQKLTVVAMTGVTALVRATAFMMEQHGMTYPGQDIRQWLSGADITHISNEVPFAENCPYPDPVQADVIFCSRDAYIELLEDIGTDVLELTGDHFQDWGTEAMFHTLDAYRTRGWLYYGGGMDLADGRKAAFFENNGNRVAFIGCNGKGGSFAQASETNPGAAACDLAWMSQEISRLKQEGYLVIGTFQHHEYYTYSAQPDQQQDFRQLAEAGAVIVSGSQAHQPQGMEFLNGSFIHYGLGNLFFDQYDLCPACRQGLIDRHVFYDGRYISTELLPIQFIDYARSRPMTFEESSSLLQTLFSASGW
jgi:poly-gamma-glutamate synthesis protein (capsule biosynthesis protein)